MRVVVWLALLVAAPVRAADDCVARFVLPHPVLGATSIAVDGSSVTLGGCTATHVRVGAPRRSVRRLRARWTSCDGVRSLRLRARVAADCRGLTGTLRGRRLPRMHLAAPVSACGDGIVDTDGGEACDDGNVLSGDTCEPDCQPCNPVPPTFADAWDGVRTNLFHRYGCVGCHGGAAPSAGMALDADDVYAQLLEPSQSLAGAPRLAPGDANGSVLWLKIAKRTFGGHDDLQGNGMPQAGALVPATDLTALGAWIDAGAPMTGVVPGTDPLLLRCRPR